MTKKNTEKTPAITPLTKQQLVVLEIIRDHIHHHGIPPTRADIARKMGFKSVNAAEDHLKALARKGAIALSPGTARGIQLIGEQTSGLPVIKLKNNQGPLLDPNNIESRYSLVSELFESSASFLLELESPFAYAGLLEGDLLAIRQSTVAKDSQIVLICLNNTRFIAIYTHTKEGLALIRNKDPIPLASFATEHGQELQIEGVVIGLIRKNISCK